MADSVHHLVLLSLHPECSQPGLLSLAELWYLLCVRLRIRYQTVMAPVVRVEPYEMTLLNSNPELIEKVRNVGWMPVAQVVYCQAAMTEVMYRVLM